jgi:filamentous hemagglutinin family protein
MQTGCYPYEENDRFLTSSNNRILSKSMKANTLSTSTFVIKFAFLIAGLSVIDQSVLAQVIPDQTLSSPSVVRNLGATATINGGTTTGTNLFHSFSQFSIPIGGTAFFDNSLAINNIITRVTGGESSLINGLIKTNGTANLFLINPNGILFGPNASLNVGGSFVASTANSFTFADGLEYSATKPQVAPLLAVNVPIGLQYGKGAQPISVVGSSLSVSPGKTLALVGGNVSLDGATLRARGGRIDLGGVSDTGMVGLTFEGNIPSLNFSKDVAQGNVSVASSDLRVAASGGGDIAITARNINISDDTTLGAGLLSGSGGKGGNITLYALDEVTLEGGLIFNKLFEEVNGNGGDIEVTAKSLSLSNGAQIISSNAGIGNSGNIKIATTDFVNLNGVDAQEYRSAILSNVEENAEGNSGNISISTKIMTLENEAKIETVLMGKGGTGDISISVDSLSLNKAYFLSGNDGIGNGGNILISTKSLKLNDDASISSFTVGGGNAGNLNLKAKESIFLNGDSSIFSSSASSASGNSGNISITTGSLFLMNEGKIFSILLGQGQAGNITIDAVDEVSLDGSSSQNSSYISSFVDGEVKSNGSHISVSTKSLTLTNGGMIRSDTIGRGKAGNLTLFAKDSVLLYGKSFIGSSTSTSSGDSGNISISSKTLTLDDGSFVINTTYGEGNTGNISIAVTDSIDLNGIGSSIFTYGDKTSSGNIGGINISTKVLSLNKESQIATSSAKGVVGDLVIDASESIHIDGAAISNSRSPDSDGGASNIFLNTKSLSLTNGGSVFALQNGTQQTGNINITATESVNILGTNRTGSPSIITSNTLTNLPSGNITINTPVLNISDQRVVRLSSARITSTSEGTGNAGDIVINSSRVTLDGGEIDSSMGFDSVGDGGSIRITADTLTVLNAGSIQTSTDSRKGGNAGDTILSLSDSLNLLGIGSGIAAQTRLYSTGNGGNVFIDSPTVTLANGGIISVGSFTGGTGGSIELQADSLTLDNGIISAATASTNGGNVNLGVQNLLLANNNSTISATAGGSGNGGNLNLNAGFLVLNSNSSITANAFQGQGGNIQITTQGIFPSRNSKITASSDLGVNGTVQLTVTDPDPSRGLFSLPETVVDASGLVSQKCDATISKDSQQSEFIVTGRGGIPPNPSESLQDESILSSWVTLPHAEKSSKQPAVTIAPSNQENARIAIAQGWKVDPDGTVVLTAEPSTINATPTWQPLVKCRA